MKQVALTRNRKKSKEALEKAVDYKNSWANFGEKRPYKRNFNEIEDLIESGSSGFP